MFFFKSRRVDQYIGKNSSRELIASIFRVKNSEDAGCTLLRNVGIFLPNYVISKDTLIGYL